MRGNAKERKCEGGEKRKEIKESICSFLSSLFTPPSQLLSFSFHNACTVPLPQC